MLSSLFDFSNTYMLYAWIGIYLILNVLGFVFKKSCCNLITLVFSLAFLTMHAFWCGDYANGNIDLMIDFITLAISVFAYLFVDDIESRRKVISEVFENRYKKRNGDKDESTSSKSTKV